MLAIPPSPSLCCEDTAFNSLPLPPRLSLVLLPYLEVCCGGDDREAVGVQVFNREVEVLEEGLLLGDVLLVEEAAAAEVVAGGDRLVDRVVRVLELVVVGDALVAELEGAVVVRRDLLRDVEETALDQVVLGGLLDAALPLFGGREAVRALVALVLEEEAPRLDGERDEVRLHAVLLDDLADALRDDAEALDALPLRGDLLAELEAADREQVRERQQLRRRDVAQERNHQQHAQLLLEVRLDLAQQDVRVPLPVEAEQVARLARDHRRRALRALEQLVSLAVVQLRDLVSGVVVQLLVDLLNASANN